MHVQVESEEPRRLVVVAHDLGPWGGQERALEEFALKAVDQGYDVQVVAFRASAEVSEAATVHRVPRIPGPFVLRFLWFWALSTARIRTAASVGPAVVLACGAITPASVDGVWMHFWHAEHLRSVGWFCSWPGSALRFGSQSIARAAAWLAELYVLHLGSRTAVLVAVSHSEARALSKRYRHRDVEVLPNPVRTTVAGSRVRQNDQDERVVVFLGGEWGRKGLAFAARCLGASSRQIGAPVALKVFGAGSRREIARLRRIAGLRVEHAAWTSDPVSELLAADAFILASRYETFSMAGHEALAAGLPVITTEVHGLADAVRETGCGVVADRSVEAFTRALTAVLSADRGDSSERARRYIEDHFSSAAVDRARDELLEKLWSRRIV
ncbi:hypothetical protein DEI92_03160 [Curtobacterium sp. MCBD17_034]|nr:hypothetical protein DEI92_03160 [Curtobacterium sp. MCBD17_034]PZM39799.1 hypothetical protein DEI90_02945 [Curtobacterium sp. MCBD17_031]